MKILLILMIFLLSIPIVLAQNITLGNITIKIPNVTTPRIPNITTNQTRTVDVLEILRSLKISDVLQERLKKIYDFMVDALVASIAKTLKELLPDLVEILITGNVTNKTNVSS